MNINIIFILYYFYSQDYVVAESYLYNDIIQERFHDTYNNLTLKSVMLLKWANTYCDKGTYLMKSDDDIFVNIPSLLKILKKRIVSTGTLIGSLISDVRPIVDPKNKWYRVYKEFTKYIEIENRKIDIILT